jgi:WD40 repeat protein
MPQEEAKAGEGAQGEGEETFSEALSPESSLALDVFGLAAQAGYADEMSACVSLCRATSLDDKLLRGHDMGRDRCWRNWRNTSRLILACEVGSLARVRHLLVHGADLKHQDRYYRTAMVEATLQCRPEVMRVLREAGAQPFAPLQGRKVATLEGHTGMVSALSVLPDGRLASAAFDCSIKIWDPSRGGELDLTLTGHEDWVRALSCLADGTLASCSEDSTIRLWCTGTSPNALPPPPYAAKRPPAVARCLHVLRGHTGAVLALCALPDGRLASGSYDKDVRLWERTGEGDWRAGLTLSDHVRGVYALSLLPGRRLASGSADYSIRVWDTLLGVRLLRLEGHQGIVASLAVLPDGRLASGSHDRTIRVWDTLAGSCDAILSGHNGWVDSLAVLPDGRLASGSVDTTVRIWAAALNAHVDVSLPGHAIEVSALAVLPDGRLASASDDWKVRLWT